jgi:MarR family transcriptional regulator, lower aerobic nicotinate degradation pathway regulator
MSLPAVNRPTHRTAALLDYLARRMRLRAESALAPLGLRPRHLVALTVLRDGGGSTQQALSTTLQIDRTNLVGLLNELEAENLIERRRSSEDRRRHIVELTPTGADMLADVEAALAAVEDEVLGGLDDEQRETLYSLLQQATSDHAPDCARTINEC